MPIPKESSCHDVQSFWPIFLLSIILSKCLEKHLYQRLLEHFESNFVLSESQFGFRKGHSTIIPLMVAVHHWHHFLERKQQVLCVFFDIRKAFDSVPHQALLNKLSSLDVPFILLRWLTSYLTSRLQRVILGGVSSPWLPVKSGIPQASVLGPLLFLSYDLASLSFSSGTNILMFADDIVLYKLISSQWDSSDFQADVDLLASWAKSNHLSLNACDQIKADVYHSQP